MAKKENSKSKQTKKIFSVKKTKEKIDYYFSIITDTILWVEKYKVNDIINASDLNVCIQNLENIYIELTNIKDTLNSSKKNTEQIIKKLQKINDELSMLFKTFGTKNIKYILDICHGPQFLKKLKLNNNCDKEKLDLILEYAHPIYYKIMPWKNKPKNINKKTGLSNLILRPVVTH